MHVVVVAAEDEALIIMELVDHLTDEGFTVLEARHADEAIAVLEREAAGVHVLFTDVHMPGASMDGIALSHHVSVHWPWIGIIVTSSHAAPEPEHLPVGCRFLPKPYFHRHVVQHVRELAKAA